MPALNKHIQRVQVLCSVVIRILRWLFTIARCSLRRSQRASVAIFIHHRLLRVYPLQERLFQDTQLLLNFSNVFFAAHECLRRMENLLPNGTFPSVLLGDSHRIAVGLMHQTESHHVSTGLSTSYHFNLSDKSDRSVVPGSIVNLPWLKRWMMKLA